MVLVLLLREFKLQFLHRLMIITYLDIQTGITGSQPLAVTEPNLNPRKAVHIAHSSTPIRNLQRLEQSVVSCLDPIAQISLLLQ